MSNLDDYCWLHSFLLILSYFRIRHYFPYTLEKVQKPLFTTVRRFCLIRSTRNQTVLISELRTLRNWSDVPKEFGFHLLTFQKVNFSFFFFFWLFCFHLSNGNGTSAPILTLLSSTWNDSLKGPGSLCMYMWQSSTIKNM